MPAEIYFSARREPAKSVAVALWWEKHHLTESPIMCSLDVVHRKRSLLLEVAKRFIDLIHERTEELR